MGGKKRLLGFLIVLILSSCSSGNRGENIETFPPPPSETALPSTSTSTSTATNTSTATVTSTTTVDYLKTAVAKVTKTAIVKLTENSLVTSTPIPTNSNVPQEFGWDAYKRISFDEFLESHVEELSFYNAGLTYFSEKYKVSAEYLFEHREISAEDKLALVSATWFVYGESTSEDVEASYQEELLFNIEGKQFWFPVHEFIASDYDELVVGQDIDVYIIVVAVTHEEDSYTWIIINTAFVECDITDCN